MSVMVGRISVAVIGLCLRGSNSKIFFVEEGVLNIKADFWIRLRESGTWVRGERTDDSRNW